MTASATYRPISQEVLSHDWGKLTKFRYELLRSDGAWQQQTRETYDRGNGATCLLYDPDTNCVLLTRQFRLPVYLNGGRDTLIETPAALLDGADAAARMRKELIEETGYEIADLTHLYDVYMSPGSVTEYLAFFTGTYSDQDKTAQGGGKYEDIEVIRIPLSKAMQMIQTGDICDAKTIILLQHLTIKHLSRGQEL